jgi:hypothetical protein
MINIQMLHTCTSLTHFSSWFAAKAYIESLRVAAAAAGDDDLGLHEQLADEAAAAAGRLNKKFVDKLLLSEYAPRDGMYGTGNFVRGDRLSTTAVALSSDDSKAFTVSKCGCVTIWDIENISRRALLQHSLPISSLGHQW